VELGVPVLDELLVPVWAFVGVRVIVAEFVSDAVLVAVLKGVNEGVRELVADKVLVAVLVPVGEEVAVGLGEEEGVHVGVEEGVCVTEAEDDGVAITSRTRLFPRSAMYSRVMPSIVSTATETDSFKRPGAGPLSPAKPAMRFPAILSMVPQGVIARMAWLLVSAI